MRNILAHLPAKGKAAFAEKLKQIWLMPDLDSAKAYAHSLMDTYEKQYPAAIEILESGLEDSLQFYNFEQIDHRKISSTNMLERLNREIRRRTSVVGIFPSIDSYTRLVTSYLNVHGSTDGVRKQAFSKGRQKILPEAFILLH